MYTYFRKRKRPKLNSRKKTSEGGERKGRSSGSNSNPRRGRRKNPSARNSTKNTEVPESNNVDINPIVEPPSFESIEHDLNLNENSSHSLDMPFGSYRKYL